MDPSQLTAARSILKTAVANRAFPGAVLTVGYQGETTMVSTGSLTYDEDSAAVAADTIYDLASLTKVVSTTTAAMILHGRGALELDRPVEFYLADFKEPGGTTPDPLRAARADVTVQDLLAHTSGLPAYERFFLRARRKSHVLSEALVLPLETSPGERTLYSDVGFILLGAIIEQVSGKSLDAFYESGIRAPLEMQDTLFNPSPALWGRIAPTEEDLEFRRRLIRGEVHDENAWVMGGVAGHAGLFGAAADLARFCSMMLAGGKAGGKQILKPETIREFTRPYPATEGAARGLGWDKPTQPASCGRYFSASSYGHLGFTGTSIWIDPEEELFVVLLTNRVHPSRANDAIRSIRPALHNAVVKGLSLM